VLVAGPGVGMIRNQEPGACAVGAVSLPHTARPFPVTGRVAFRADAACGDGANSRRRGAMAAAEAAGVCLLHPRRSATGATSGRRRIHQTTETDVCGSVCLWQR
jgi:hypothetical protein